MTLMIGASTPSFSASSFATFAVFIDAVRPNRWTGDFLYAMGWWGALAADLFPDWATRPILNIFTWQSFTIHALILGYVVMRPLVAVSQLPTRAGMPLAMGLVLVSLFVLISRKKALTQVVAFLMLENGIALLALLGTYGIPLIVELGVFLDALLGFIVMQIFVYRIHETFETMDVDQLRRLRH